MADAININAAPALWSEWIVLRAHIGDQILFLECESSQVLKIRSTTRQAVGFVVHAYWVVVGRKFK